MATAEAGPAMDRVESRGVLTVCADPYIYPASEANAQPPGFDIEIVQAVAEKNGWRTNHVWPDTGTRGGLGRAMRQSIQQGACEVFVGIGVSPDSEDEMEEKNLVFARPYMAVGYVLVVQGEASDAGSIDALKERGIEIGVPMSTPIDAYLFDNDYERELYFGSDELVAGLVEGEIDAAMVWSTNLAEARRDNPDHAFTVAPGYEPPSDMKWDYAMVVPDGEPELLEKINTALTELVRDGTVKGIVESYDVPYMLPSDISEIETAEAQAEEATAAVDDPAATEPGEGDIENPFSGDAEAIEYGEERFAARCAFCHGGGGGGAKGPNLIDDKWKYGSTNEAIFYNIAAGIPDTQMGAFGTSLSGDEIWKIMAYLEHENKKLEQEKAEGN